MVASENIHQFIFGMEKWYAEIIRWIFAFLRRYDDTVIMNGIIKNDEKLTKKMQKKSIGSKASGQKRLSGLKGPKESFKYKSPNYMVYYQA